MHFDGSLAGPVAWAASGAVPSARIQYVAALALHAKKASAKKAPRKMIEDFLNTLFFILIFGYFLAFFHFNTPQNTCNKSG
jgi:hypothetical protein